MYSKKTIFIVALITMFSFCTISHAQKDEVIGDIELGVNNLPFRGVFHKYSNAEFLLGYNHFINRNWQARFSFVPSWMREDDKSFKRDDYRFFLGIQRNLWHSKSGKFGFNIITDLYFESSRWQSFYDGSKINDYNEKVAGITYGVAIEYFPFKRFGISSEYLHFTGFAKPGCSMCGPPSNSSSYEGYWTFIGSGSWRMFSIILKYRFLR